MEDTAGPGGDCMTTATELVTVASYETAVQADLARGLLEGNGIKAVLSDVQMATTTPYAYATGGVGLQVLRSDAGRAVEILRAYEAAVREASGEEALVEDEADTACIACGAAIPEYLDRCPACGWTYS
jgi:hypothetical protein